MRLEVRIYDEQADTILRDCGRKAMEQANYGWGVDDDGHHLSVATKVYGHGVLISEVTRPHNKKRAQIFHRWR